MARITEAVGSAGVVVDVGAGTGSYEPRGTVLAVEPSLEMIGQRAARPPAVQAVAERLPVRDNAAEVALAVLTVHHWTDWRRGLAELRRISSRQVVLAYDPRKHVEFWVTREYVPEIAGLERGRPGADEIAEELGADRVEVLPVPWDFTDGVFPAYWRRPEAYLDERVRRNSSAFAQTDPEAVRRGITKLRRDLADGTWHRNHADLLEQQEIDVGFRLITSRA
ncbi:class I SAM-dependent methyltransferase [Amycolatopsis sp. NPDC051903]|uniref:class I SAM-dependent methyltransferase n=1 Tax=Amycolatopsis sp. NPDC051903 TaxID=3363936 RepID=UPI0037AF8A78